MKKSLKAMHKQNKKFSGIWQKRFSKEIDKRILNFTSSIEDDERLVLYDIDACLAHIKMLRKEKIISPGEFRKLKKGLKKIAAQYKKGKFKLRREYEDVHINIEIKLRQFAGNAADKLHTARSRNDLVATDLRLYTRDTIKSVMKLLIDIKKALLKNARDNFGVIIPGYTHLQRAQPVLWSYYMLAHLDRFQRDLECLKDTLKKVNVSPLGSCAFAGTAHRIDPDYTAQILGFSRFADNGLDAVTDRDYLGATAFYFSQIMLHIATLAEDIIIYSTPEFNLIELDESIATGSSIMPQKKNPDVCELLRARAASSIGSLVSLMTILKSLPSSYNRDLEETKKVFFRHADETIECLNMIKLVIKSIQLKKSDWAKKPDLICATDLVDHLVKNGHAFRSAYNKVSECVRKSKGDINAFIKICAQKLKIEPSFIEKILKPENSVRAKRSKNSTGIKQTRRALKALRVRS
jgi:argininosuccinate lyase